jgi:WD40 repeat protein
MDPPLPGGKEVAFSHAAERVAGRPVHKLAVTDGSKTSVLTWIEGGAPGTATFGPLADAAKITGPTPAGVAFSPDGRQVVFIPNAKTPPAEGGKWFAQVWGGGSGRPMATLPHGAAPVTAVAWSPDHKHVATACELGDVVVWDADTFKELRCTRIGGRMGTGHVHALAFAPDGKTLAAAVDLLDAKNAERVVMLDPATGERVGTDIQGFAQAAPRALAFAPDGKTLAVGCVSREVVDTRVVGEHGLVKLYTTDP